MQAAEWIGEMLGALRREPVPAGPEPELPDIAQLEAAAPDILTMGRTAYGEARGEGDEGLSAVAHVIMNRVRAREARGQRTSPSREALRPKQFSAWNEDDPNREVMMRATSQDPRFREALEAAMAAYFGQGEDPTLGATHYAATRVLPRVEWASAMEPTTEIGGHTFMTPRRA